MYIKINLNNNSSTTKVSENFPSHFSMFKIQSFEYIENMNDVYRDKYCIKQFCESLNEHTIKIINFKKKKREVINKRAAGII